MVLRRERLGHGPSGDIAGHYTHIDDEMITEMLASLTHRLHSAVAARARDCGSNGVSGPITPGLMAQIDQARSAEPRSADRVCQSKGSVAVPVVTFR